MIAKGSSVVVKAVPSGLRKSLPASNDWLPAGDVAMVRLLEDAPFAGTLDVIDVMTAAGDTVSIYDFQIL